MDSSRESRDLSPCFGLYWLFSWQKRVDNLNKHVFGRFQTKVTVFSLFFDLVPRGILAFYVSFKYYHAPVHAQLNRNATSILRQMQSQHRDQEPNQRHAQERKGCGQGHMPQLRNLRLPHRKGLRALTPEVIFPSFFSVPFSRTLLIALCRDVPD